MTEGLGRSSGLARGGAPEAEFKHVAEGLRGPTRCIVPSYTLSLHMPSSGGGRARVQSAARGLWLALSANLARVAWDFGVILGAHVYASASESKGSVLHLLQLKFSMSTMRCAKTSAALLRSTCRANRLF